MKRNFLFINALLSLASADLFACRIVCVEDRGPERVFVLCDQRSSKGTYDVVDDSNSIVPPSDLQAFQEMNCRFDTDEPALSYCENYHAYLKTRVVESKEFNTDLNVTKNSRLVFEGYKKEAPGVNKKSFEISFSYSKNDSIKECLVNIKR